jgi:uncharacterized protein
MNTSKPSCTAFLGSQQVATGAHVEVALAVRALSKRRPHATVLIFDDESGRQIDFDLRGSEADVTERLTRSDHDDLDHNDPAKARQPGRPKLGVVAREVTLLPRHWDWLTSQPGGASAALRKLVDVARSANGGADMARRSQEAADRFMMAMAGNLPHYEEAARALYAGARERFWKMTQAWPADVAAHARRLAAGAFSERNIVRA